MKLYRLCPVCQSGGRISLHNMRFSLPENSPLPAKYSIVNCNYCGFVYADTSGRSDDYAKYYANFSKYEDVDTSTGGGNQDFDKLRINITVSWLTQYLPITSRVLDVGCGNGGMLLAFRESGFDDLSGSDSSGMCVKRVTELGFNGWQGDVLSDEFYLEFKEKFDLIILSHVLEHLVNPREAISRLLGILSHDGLLYIEVPDSSRYMDFLSVPFYYFDSEHINHFDRFSLENICNQSSCEVIDYGEKELLLYDGIKYPAVYVLAKKAPGNERAIKPSFLASDSIKRYIEQSIVDSELSSVVINAVSEKRPIVIWGAGSQAQRLMQHESMKGANIIAVVDKDKSKRGLSFINCIIEAPEVGLSALPDNCLVIIVAALAANKILQEYTEMGKIYEYVIA